MCFRVNTPGPAPQNAPPPIVARNPNLQRLSELAPKKKLVDEEEVTGVEYGSGKEGGAAQAKKVGADSLRIALNTGSDIVSAGQGGLNV